MDTMDYELRTDDFKTYSVSKCKRFIGMLITDNSGKPLNGVKKTSNGMVVRFKDGYIDGGYLPAIEYEDGGTEWWTKGYPDGLPAVITDFGSREEYWENGKLIKIVSQFEIVALSTEKG